MLGFFDENIVKEGWFAPETQPSGWFDAVLLTTSSGGGSYQLGYTTIGAVSLGSITDSTTLGSRFTASQSGTVSKITVRTNIGASGTATFRVAIFSNGGGNTIGSLIASSSPINVTNTSPQWIDVPITASVTSGQDYWLFAWGDASGFSSDFTYYADANAISNTIVTSFGNSYPDWSTVGDGVNENYDMGYMSICATVTTSSGYTLSCSNGSYSLSGQAVGLTTHRKLTATHGDFQLIGQSVNLNRGLRVALSQGDYSYTGQTLNFKRGLVLSAVNGQYTYTGQSTNLSVNRRISLNQGVYSISGQSINLNRGLRLSATQGSYTLSGQNATLVYTPVGAYTIVCHQGSYLLSGQSVGLIYTPLNNYTLVLSQGAYTYTGQSVGLRKANRIQISEGVFDYSGQTVNLNRGSRLNLSTGSFTLMGNSANFYIQKTKRRYFITS